MKELINKKTKTLKLAIEKYNMYKRFADKYNESKSLEEYINHILLINANASTDVLVKYESMIRLYRNGDDSQLLNNLFEHLLNADEYKTKVADELKALLREL